MSSLPEETVITKTKIEPALDLQEELPIQLIFEDKKFNTEVTQYLTNTISKRESLTNNNYHVISVFGSQSSGKSTLLNTLFHTNFDTMDAQVKRQQTTKGIWLGHSKSINCSENDYYHYSNDANNLENPADIYVLDVEGSDGAERGEDQEFERKAALFALAVSEVLIINMWEQQVGLYQGNNMGLLKTVFEVNLSLFGKSGTTLTGDKHKILLLFIIRDHIGVTPLESLQESIENELDKMWNTLSKPEGYEDTTFHDFFDVKFKGLAHKILQNDKFIEGVKNLGDQVINKPTASNSLFKPEYHYNLPLEGWALYSENCWNTIENSVELDLPTQQILVAKFKTKEFADASFNEFTVTFNNGEWGYDHDPTSIAETLSNIKNVALEYYDKLASRYHKPVYQEERDILLTNIKQIYEEYLTGYTNAISSVLLNEFDTLLPLSSKKKSFTERSASAKSQILTKFDAKLQPFQKSGLVESVDKYIDTFTKVLDEKIEAERLKEFQNLFKKFEKNISRKMTENIDILLSDASPDFWDKLLTYFTKINKDFMMNFEVNRSSIGEGITDAGAPVYDFNLGFSNTENEQKYQMFLKASWSIFSDVIKKNLTVGKLPSVLEGVFEKKFLYDENDSPKFFTNVSTIDAEAEEGKDYANKMLDVFSIAKTTDDDSEIIPPVQLADDDEEEEEEEDEYKKDNGLFERKSFAHILNETEKERVRIELKKKIQIVILQTKRSVLTNSTKIPPWIFVLLIILGFNEFMMVLRHPLLLTLFILGVSFWFFIHRTNSYKAFRQVTVVTAKGIQDAATEKLKDLLLDGKDKKVVE
ncbi:related to Protein SEY1 [Saccharomycodes ludwigii]|uniref:Related to Protein SEY1 n=1 Tax=Saccharomycodes ludwigii TaxID=36035 RepID=A0A376BA35_9ASCO|nr:hypothetical protein SCDLUD_000919 [Saccharomycodes ludwigii]KAH3903294.1 hypothetical protein SCDLUD_000919 [Saccharomycodes ludwigii]SSD61517.1 related to Protein SEY1 [Saccharomycodes ludwigii]